MERGGQARVGACGVRLRLQVLWSEVLSEAQHKGVCEASISWGLRCRGEFLKARKKQAERQAGAFEVGGDDNGSRGGGPCCAKEEPQHNLLTSFAESFDECLSSRFLIPIHPSATSASVWSSGRFWRLLLRNRAESPRRSCSSG